MAGIRITQAQFDKWVAEGKIKNYVVMNKPLVIDPADHLKKPKKPGRAKYRNSKVEWDGMVFDSKKEYQRYRVLLLLQKAGKIARLQRQVKYKLYVDEKLIATYIADHVYMDAETGDWEVEDVKSDITRKLPTYRLKKKLMKAIYNIDIKEV